MLDVLELDNESKGRNKPRESIDYSEGNGATLYFYLRRIKQVAQRQTNDSFLFIYLLLL